MATVTLGPATNPIVVTSADTFTAVAATVAVRIIGFYWDGGASGANGDTVLVTDGDDKKIWSATLKTGELGERSLELGRVIQTKGLKITAPTHGTLYVYLADSYA